MRPLARIFTLGLVLALVAALAGCGSGGGSAELEADETPVPDGMPVMYEFYTTT
ncbi:MAG: hypothetical protein VB139_00545 [Coriobacteriia bacterium]|jgi:predicted small lipoprotein YifL|nr:hypothetical protein [Coriobacteriia bacterium]